MSTRKKTPDQGGPLRAAVLVYDPLADGAPRLVAKGHGEVAERMLALANANGLAVHQDAGLLNFLMRVDLEEQIPAELYTAVAAVLAKRRAKNPVIRIVMAFPNYEPHRRGLSGN